MPMVTAVALLLPSMAVVPAPAPTRVRFFSMSRCSAYVPAAMLIVSPACAWPTAYPMVWHGVALQSPLLLPVGATKRVVPAAATVSVAVGVAAGVGGVVAGVGVDVLVGVSVTVLMGASDALRRDAA